MQTQIDQMANALLNGTQPGQPTPPDQAMNPIGAAPNQNAQAGMNSAPFMGGMLGNGTSGILQMLMNGAGPMGLMNMLQGKKDTDGNPQAASDTPSPGEFSPGGQPNPSSTAVTPF